MVSEITSIYKIYDVQNSIYSTDSSLYIKYIYAVENGRYSTDLCYICHLYTTNIFPITRELCVEVINKYTLHSEFQALQVQDNILFESQVDLLNLIEFNLNFGIFVFCPFANI